MKFTATIDAFLVLERQKSVCGLSFCLCGDFTVYSTEEREGGLRLSKEAQRGNY